MQAGGQGSHWRFLHEVGFGTKLRTKKNNRHSLVRNKIRQGEGVYLASQDKGCMETMKEKLLLVALTVLGGAAIVRAQSRPLFDENVEHLAHLSSPGFEAKPDISDDGLTLLYASDQVGGVGDLDVWVATRPDRHSPFGVQTNVTELNSADRDHTPTTTADELLVIFSSSRPGGTGSDDAWMSTRANVNSPWNAPNEVPILNSVNRDMGFTMTPDGLVLYYTSNRPGAGGFDLYTSTRASLADGWSAPAPVAELNTQWDDRFPTVSGDNTILMFSSNRPGSVPDANGDPSDDIWVAMRPSASSAWTVVENLYELNTADVDLLSSIANDQSEFFFVSSRVPSLGGLDLFRTEAIPGVRRYGVGQAGTVGEPRLRTIGGAPTVGNAHFGFEISNLPAQGRLLYWVSLDPAPGPQIWVGAPLLFLGIASPWSDPFHIPVPIPDDDRLAGLTGYCQVFVIEPSTGLRAGFTSLAISPGLSRTVQPAP